MRKDTKTFLSTVFGIPLILGGVWVFNAADEARVVVFQREPVVAVEPEVPQATEPVKEVPVVGTATPAAPAPKPKPPPAKVVAQPPVAVPPPAVTPVVVTVVETPQADPAPTKRAVVKKSRRTRAS